MAAQRSGSILAVDFGSVHTRAVLIDLVDGVYRLVARAESRTTNEFPVGDVLVGMARTVQRLTDVTGRRLMTSDGQVIMPERPDRSGVDSFAATTSTGRPLRTAVVGLAPDVSIASALRAAAGTYVEIVETISLADERSEEAQLNALLDSQPDLIFIVGGIEDGAREPVLKLAGLARLAVELVQHGHMPTVLYAGNSALAPHIRRLFAGLTTVFDAPNVRPSLDEENLEEAQLRLALAFDERQGRRSGGFEAVAQMTSLGILPTAQSYDLIVNYLGQIIPGGVLVVDVGSAVSTLSAFIGGQVTTAIRTDIGLGHSAESLRALVGDQAIRDWLPFADSPNQLRHYTLNKTLRPATIPETARGLFLEHGLLRAGIRALLAAARPAWPAGQSGVLPPFSYIIGAGAALTRTGHPGFNALLLLDSLQPTGAAVLQADPHGLIAALGALAPTNPEAVVQVLDSLSLERLGVCFCPTGHPAPGKTALKVKITTASGQVIRQEVAGGSLWVYPLGVGQEAKVEVSAGRGLKIGGRSRMRAQVEGGAAGLIFDARGRPLALANSPAGRAEQMLLWQSQITGDPVVDVSSQAAGADEFAAPLAADEPDDFRRGRRDKTPRAAAKAKPVRARFGRRQAAPSVKELADDDTIDELDKLRQ